jgi:hypothetical protein
MVLPWPMSAGLSLATDRCEGRAVLGVFSLLACFHFWGATVAWESLNLPGAEFRQTQTAISAYYIQQDNDYSLAYPTPVLGKPWSIPMEFPLYQWTVATFSTATGTGLTQAGRTVSLVCFYLTLPALFLLLGRLGLARRQRWIVLGLVLTCPLYIYYARAFLIETMALMFGAWFLLAFLNAVERRSWRWLLLANLAGMGAGLVKVTTFMLFLMPAGLWAAWWMWQARPRSAAPVDRRLFNATGWIAATTAVPFALSLWWIRWADAIKQLNPSARFIQSGSLTDFNFGTTANRFSPDTLLQHWQHLTTAVVWPPVLGVGLVLALTVSRHWWRPMLLCLGCYLAVLVLFPVLYALHEYYAVANAIFLLGALGFAVAGLWESPLPRWAAALLVLGIYAAQMQFYLQGFYPGQSRVSPGGSGLTEALRQVMDPREILVVAGDDWSSITPFFAQRRALMIRNGQQDQTAYLRAAFGTLADERVGAVVLEGALRNHNQLRDLLIETFELDRRPIFTWRDALVYVPVEARTHSISQLRGKSFNDIRLAADARLPAPGALAAEWWLLSDITPEQQQLFAAMDPRPVGFYSSFGPALAWRAGEPWFNAHPTTRFRFHLAAGRHRLQTKVIIAPEAYLGPFKPNEPPTDGVEIQLAAREGGAVPRILYTRLLDPSQVAGDRGEQPIDISFLLARPAQVDLFFGPGPLGRDTHDWISVGRVKFD